MGPHELVWLLQHMGKTKFSVGESRNMIQKIEYEEYDEYEDSYIKYSDWTGSGNIY